MSNENALAVYKTAEGKEITLTSEDIRDLISDNPKVTDRECVLFASMCKNYGIDPFIKEAYLVKYKDNPAQMIVGKDYWMKQAGKHQQYDGMESGVTVAKGDGSLERREGTLVGQRSEKLVGGWARVFRKDRTHPSFCEVSLAEYSTGRSMWKEADQGGKPATMIAKVAEVQALRKAFPETFSGLYDRSEMGDGGPQEVEATYEAPEAPQQPQQPAEPDARHKLADACARYAAKAGSDAREVMAAQVQRADYPGRDAEPAVLDAWFAMVADELDASEPPAVTAEAGSADQAYGEYYADEDIDF